VMRWQFAHNTLHFAIAFLNSYAAPPVRTMLAASILFSMPQ